MVIGSTIRLSGCRFDVRKIAFSISVASSSVLGSPVIVWSTFLTLSLSELASVLLLVVIFSSPPSVLLYFGSINMVKLVGSAFGHVPFGALIQRSHAPKTGPYEPPSTQPLPGHQPHIFASIQVLQLVMVAHDGASHSAKFQVSLPGHTAFSFVGPSDEPYMHFLVDLQKPHSGFAKHSPHPEVISGQALNEVAFVAFFVSLPCPSISLSNFNNLSKRDEFVALCFVLLCVRFLTGGNGSISTPVSSSTPVAPVAPVMPLPQSPWQSPALFNNLASCASFVQLTLFLGQPSSSFSNGDSISLKGTSSGDTVYPSLLLLLLDAVRISAPFVCATKIHAMISNKTIFNFIIF